jgi:hypothetical protein
VAKLIYDYLSQIIETSCWDKKRTMTEGYVKVYVMERDVSGTRKVI